MTENQGSIPEREPERRLPHPRKAAGAQITQSRLGEVVTRNNEAGLLTENRRRIEHDPKPRREVHWRASLVPAAAVIPAPIAYIKVVAVKKLVVGFGVRPGRYRREAVDWPTATLLRRGPRVPLTVVCVGTRDVYFEEIRVFKTGRRLDTQARNNGTGPGFCFVGFRNRGND